MLLAILGGGCWGAIPGLLKSYCNVNEVISGIMLNWIVLYLTNKLLTSGQGGRPALYLSAGRTPMPGLPPSLGRGALFNDNQYVGLALPLSIVIAVWCGWCWMKTASAMSSGHWQQQERRQVLRHGGKAQHHPDPGHLRCWLAWARPCST